MASNNNLHLAKATGDDEFYTRYEDIESEIVQYWNYNRDLFKDKTVLLPCDDPDWSNFTKFFLARGRTFGLKRLISTSYDKNGGQGKLYIREWVQGKLVKNTVSALNGDGDFRSDEVTALRDQSDFVITNPPFSLFREFVSWIMEGSNQFLIIGNKSAPAYKETWSLIQDVRMWLGCRPISEEFLFIPPSGWDPMKLGLKPSKYAYEDGELFRRAPVAWFTNIDHGKRHERLPLMSMEDNKTYSNDYKRRKDRAYKQYVNYNAIEVPTVKLIPSDYTGPMGVPVTFLDKLCPDQFEILGTSGGLAEPMSEYASKGTYQQGGPSFYLDNGDGTYTRLFNRVVIKHKTPTPRP
jgi:hypothetical protein